MSDVQAVIEISKAVHAALSGDADVQGALGTPPRLYDHAPADPVFPYLTYGSLRSADRSGHGAVICAHDMTLHLWSRYGGRGEVLDCLSAVTGALERDVVNLSGMTLVRTQVTSTDIFRAPDGQTLHGLIRLSLITDKEPIQQEGAA